ncbi:MAG: putative porin [Candidatus Aphodosoma sp.]
MKKILILLILSVYCTGFAMSQGRSLPTVQPQKDTVKIDIRVWQIDGRYGEADTVMIDTVVASYQDNTPVNNYSIANSWNGNLGSPVESKIFFDRSDNPYENMFARAYRPYIILPEDVRYYNTRKPFSQLVYRSAFPSHREEDNLRVMLTFNANKRVNVGGLCNFIYGRGQYQYQSSQMLTGGFWTTYGGDQYQLNASVMFNSFKNRENGGIIDNNYIINPEAVIGTNTIQANNIPVNMDQTQSEYRNFVYHLNHRYNIGRYIDVRQTDDTAVTSAFQPIISIIHTFRAEDVRRKYKETDSILNNFYLNNYYSGRYSSDSTAYWSIRNTIAVSLNEKFNSLMKFGLAAFVEYDVRHYGIGYDSITVHRQLQHNLKVGGLLSKREGRYIKYNVDGEVFLVGPHIGEFDVKGNLVGLFNIAKEPVTVSAGAKFQLYSTFEEYKDYYSNHFRWDSLEYKKQISLDIHGRISLPKRNTSLGVQFRNITNYVYLDEAAIPQQYGANIQVLAVDLTTQIKMWRFYLDAKAVYQLTSNRDILPLPDVALYGNFYYKDLFFKVLTVQLGVSVRYHTAYYGNVWMPALGQFHLQRELKVGNYPEMNVYANFHLKTVRFFVQYYHWNKGLFGKSYLSMPGYPINPGTFQFGLSWNFWN